MPIDNDWAFNSKRPQATAAVASKAKSATAFLGRMNNVLKFTRVTPVSAVIGFAVGWGITKIADALTEETQEISYANFNEIKSVKKSTLPITESSLSGFQGDYTKAEQNKFNVLENIRDDMTKSFTVLSNAVLAASTNNAATIANSNAVLAAQLGNIAKILAEQFNLNKEVAKERISQDIYNKQIDATQADYSDLTTSIRDLGTSISRAISNSAGSKSVNQTIVNDTAVATAINAQSKSISDAIKSQSNKEIVAALANLQIKHDNKDVVTAINNLQQKGSTAAISNSIDKLATKMDNAELVAKLAQISTISQSIDKIAANQASAQKEASETTRTMFDAQKKFYEREIASSHAMQNLREKNLELDKQIAEFKTKEVIINNEKVSPLSAEFQKDLTDAKVNDFNLKVHSEVKDLDDQVVAKNKSVLQMQAYKTIAEARLKTDEANQQDLLDDRDLDYSDLLGGLNMLEIIPTPTGVCKPEDLKKRFSKKG